METNARMKLLIVTQSVDSKDTNLGFFVRWIQEFAKHVSSIEVICLQKGEYVLPENVHIHSLGKETRQERTSVYVLRFFSLIWKLRGRYDAVFVHMNPEYVVLGGLFWKLSRKPVLLWYTHKAVSVWLRIASLWASKILTASPESLRLKTKKAKVMGHGIDTERVLPPRTPSEGSLRLMTSGRISPIKHLEVLVEAFSILKRKGLPVTFKIFGAPISSTDLAYRQSLEHLLGKEGIVSEEVLVGAAPHAQMPEHRTHADYFLHASETGSFDKAVLDAIISGLLPISSSEAYKELFRDFEDSLTFPRSDAHALAERVFALNLLPEEERLRMSDTLKERVRSKHSLASLVTRIFKEF